MQSMNSFCSNISGKEYPVTERICGKTIRHSILNLIRKDYPEFTEDSCLSLEELDFYREKYIAEYLKTQIEEITEIEKTVLTSLTEKSTLTDKIDGDKNMVLSFGQRIADNVATFGGSWTFIISFAVFIALWISVNVYWLANKGFDPYPFILLNLILSCIAAIQAPVIMMSQNRQEDKDRERAKKDYMVNLKSELEIRMLHEKLDHLMIHQQQELLEIQKVQIEMMSDILKEVNAKSK
jgi:uncharacterized membrane protein